MNEEQLKQLAEGLASLQGRAKAEDDEKARMAAEKEESDTRSALQNKFGSLYSNDEDVGELVLQGLRERGASVESATEEAVREMILTPLSQMMEKMTKAISGTVKGITDSIKTQAAEVASGGPAGGELGIPPVDAGLPPPPDAGLPPPPDMGALPPDAGLPPPPDMGAPPPPPDPNMMLSDARMKHFGKAQGPATFASLRRRK